jgi:hypothetical protein
LSVRKSERVIVIEAQAKRKRITNHHRDANQNNPLTGTAPPILAAGGYRYASRMDYSPILLVSAKTGEKGSGKTRNFSTRIDFHEIGRRSILKAFLE